MRCEFGLLGVESVFNLGNICTCHAFILFLDSVLRTVSDPLHLLIVDFPQFDTFQDFVPYRKPMNAGGMPRSARGYKSGHFGVTNSSWPSSKALSKDTLNTYFRSRRANLNHVLTCQRIRASFHRDQHGYSKASNRKQSWTSSANCPIYVIGGSDRRRYLMMVNIGGPNKRQATSINSVSEFNHSKRRHLYPLCKYLS